jgi:bacterial/archaeal transporter family-2 protein
MSNLFIVGILIAILAGVVVGIQTTFSSRIGAQIGPVLTGLYTNLLGGVVAGVILLAVAITRGWSAVAIPRETGIYLTLAGSLGLLIVMGISFAFGRIGVTAGTAAVILGQIVVGVVVDTLGLAGAAPVPLEGRRILGLLVLGVAVFLLLPKSGN